MRTVNRWGGARGLCTSVATVCLMLLADVGAAAAQQAPSSGGRSAGIEPQRADDRSDVSGLGLLPGRPSVRPRRTDTPPDLDGRLDDDVWRSAATLTKFTQESPLEGAPATEDTEVYIAYDDDSLYFGFYLHYSDPSIMRANRVDRDMAWQDDLITIYIDTFLDQQRGYDFDVNGYGVQGDGIMSAARRIGRGRGGVADAVDYVRFGADQLVRLSQVGSAAAADQLARHPRRQRIAGDAGEGIGAAALKCELEARRGQIDTGLPSQLLRPLARLRLDLDQVLIEPAVE